MFNIKALRSRTDILARVHKWIASFDVEVSNDNSIKKLISQCLFFRKTEVDNV